MQPNSQPTPTDVAAVDAFLGNSPTPSPQPNPTAPIADPTPAPTVQPEATPAPVTETTPTEPVDPFASLFPTEPATPAEPVTEVTQPTEPVAPTEPSQPIEPTPQPTESTPTETQPAEPKYQTYEEYMASIIGDLPEAVSQPDPEQIDPNDPEAIKNFFGDLVKAAVEQTKTETARQEAIRNAEKNGWDDAFNKYGTLRENKQLRDMVHHIRMGYFNQGVALTPSQAAEKLLDSLGAERRAGAASTKVVTTIEEVQPNGGSSTPMETTLDRDNTLESLQTGGETALANFLDKQIKAGKL